MGRILKNNRWVQILVLLPLWLTACASAPEESGQKFSAQQKFEEALQAQSLNQYEYQRNYDFEHTYWWFVGVRKMVDQLLALARINGQISPGQRCS